MLNKTLSVFRLILGVIVFIALIAVLALRNECVLVILESVVVLSCACIFYHDMYDTNELLLINWPDEKSERENLRKLARTYEKQQLLRVLIIGAGIFFITLTLSTDLVVVWIALVQMLMFIATGVFWFLLTAPDSLGTQDHWQ